ncbi:ABC transporter permease [Dyadobacter chenwenxiniae]|uniref:ABC transporter permease n=1 Tax=Dyadobacter chenwenxiniae TaxID=2906456 RepID=A0A9X1THH6_9BACT|nr:ABC transporter permease [Dyadobacter chenwenxiniae]MCF0064780.1 ABC transporter permease [Dyadobacter chenwenxiniae]UON84164.1 ABC transporter permease [Dyadobacter chenwenxiniae]
MSRHEKLSKPPPLADKLLRLFCAPHLLESIQGDLHEAFIYKAESAGIRKARLDYWWEVLGFFKLRYIRRKHAPSQWDNDHSSHPLFSIDMLKNYLKIAFRNLAKHKGYSAINIGGLSLGMAVAMLIGLWIHDEFAFNKYHKNYDRIAKVMQKGAFNNEVFNNEYMPASMGKELGVKFADDFEYVIMSSWTREHILAYGDRKFTRKGNYLSAEAPDMFSLNMKQGTRAGLKDQNSILLSESVAQALFGTENPIDKIVKLDNSMNLRVTGVYEDLPYNTEFRDLSFIAPWSLYVATQNWVKTAIENNEWNNNSWQILVQISPNSDFATVSGKIRNLKLEHAPETAFFKPELFLQPMQKWHLYTGWDKAGNLDGRIQYVWLFGIIGVFVLLLASINFMNLSTARSEKRAKEVGIRKAVGSYRTQLINQFFTESLMVVTLAFVLSVLLVIVILPFFNEVADKKIDFPFKNVWFWLFAGAFTMITGIFSGIYPAIYLSSFQPVKVLKGVFHGGRYTSIPRKALVVLQFTVSVTLIIGTIIVFKQIQHAKNRPVGYDRSGLITVNINTPELHEHYNALRSDLLKTGAVVEMSTSSTPTTDMNSSNDGYDWEGKDPNFKENFGTIAVSHDFGKTVGWQFIEGRDLSREFATDSSGMVLNEKAVKYMGLKNPSEIVGKVIKWHGRPFNVVGVIKDMVMDSPFQPVYPMVFMADYNWANVINIKLNPQQSASSSLAKVGAVFRKFNPGSPFDYKFIDQQYALKFATEERIARLASAFAILAILISCLGLFGLASFTAEQRTKEIGVRKVLGASVANLWALLSGDFVKLVIVSCVISAPVAYYFLSAWLLKYEYRTEISWWVFVAAASGAMLITMITVSYQAIKAALLDPVKSLKSE